MLLASEIPVPKTSFLVIFREIRKAKEDS